MQGFIYCLPGYLFDHHSEKNDMHIFYTPTQLVAALAALVWLSTLQAKTPVHLKPYVARTKMSNLSHENVLLQIIPNQYAM